MFSVGIHCHTNDSPSYLEALLDCMYISPAIWESKYLRASLTGNKGRPVRTAVVNDYDLIRIFQCLSYYIPNSCLLISGRYHYRDLNPESFRHLRFANLLLSNTG